MEKNNKADGDGCQLTFFTDFKKKFQDIKENLADKISKAMEGELDTSLTEEKSVCSEEPDIVHITDDVDETPLIERLSSDKSDNRISSRTRRPRRDTKRRKVESTARVPAVVTSDIVILTDSDDEVTVLDRLNNTSLDLNKSHDLTLEDIDEDEFLVSVKINWMDLKMHRFELRKHQKFNTVFEELAEKENVPEEKILLILRDKIFIAKEDTPDSLKLSIVDIIEGGITKEVYRNVSERKETVNKNMMEFKCVLKDQKKPLLVSIKKTDTMHCLMVKTSEQLECPIDKLKFKFEGDELECNATPEDLDLEGGEVFEVFIKK